ncbi:MAG: cob(I)yrinic acid a,c-diamide adenosyltransferase [Myxococcota bacterium]|nr:cob(I)yrinic acid a,c-diamide adenosyltransferase [Myxococcota bacterium]
MRITKVYTKTGDSGSTGLADGRRVPKNHPRIEAYGCVDELNAIVGCVRTAGEANGHDQISRLDEILYTVQNDLFELGADLATCAAEDSSRIREEDAIRLEQAIDAFNADLPPLQEFILPGGGAIGSLMHQARTVCRRAERRCLDLLDAEPNSSGEGLRYLNRLSDLLFVLGRWASCVLGEPEVLWKPRTR